MFCSGRWLSKAGMKDFQGAPVWALVSLLGMKVLTFPVVAMAGEAHLKEALAHGGIAF